MKEQFLNRMKEYLHEEYEAYVQSLDKEVYRGLRVNTSKISIEDFQSLDVCELSPSSICAQSFYIPSNTRALGNHPAHLAGLCYLQEPSASSAVEVLNVQKGDWVLDLCAAPGGKSTQIATQLNHSGFLVSNEIEPKRAQILLSNMERLGFSECMIANAHPEVLCKEMKGCFDRVLVDAPCSGEGMFKKHSKAMEDWSVEHVHACAMRQLHILDSAYMALKEDGILVYSTCAYAMEENEEVIAQFLKNYPDMQLIDPEVSFGRSGLAYEDLDTKKLIRILPMDKGEGHFVAKLKKKGKSESTKLQVASNDILPPYVKEFLQSQLTNIPPYNILLRDKLYIKQSPFVLLKKTKILRQGTLVGELVKNRIEPHQHFYTSSVYEEAYQNVYDMSEEECLSYVKGNLLQVPGYKGYTCLTWKHHPIAYAKGDGVVLKNKYPKGMRVKGF